METRKIASMIGAVMLTVLFGFSVTSCRIVNDPAVNENALTHNETIAAAHQYPVYAEAAEDFAEDSVDEHEDRPPATIEAATAQRWLDVSEFARSEGVSMNDVIITDTAPLIAPPGGLLNCLFISNTGCLTITVTQVVENAAFYLYDARDSSSYLQKIELGSDRVGHFDDIVDFTFYSIVPVYIWDDYDIYVIVDAGLMDYARD